jgi:hypothetical protein
MKNIKTYLEFKEPTVEWEKLAKDFREDKTYDEKTSLAANPFDAKDIKEIQPSNMVIKDKKKED